VGKDLFEASVQPGEATSTKIAGQLDGFMGASRDTNLLYFVSREDLDAEGPAKAGEHNLYLYRAQEGSFAFIAALSDDDARENFISGGPDPVLTPVALFPYNRSSRISPDGQHAAFASSAPLTGYDNTDRKSGEALNEAFLYDAEEGELLCVSCNPSGARPRGRAVDPVLDYWVAATIPGWENQSHASRALSEDGARLFFEATDSLSLQDTNGAQDVYQWESPGKGTCATQSPTYSPTNKGCIELISSGKSPEPSELIDASEDGRDVFFKTLSSLYPADPGLFDIYDARAAGGFPPPPPPTPACEGEACQPPSSAPQAQTPASASFQGPGDTAEPSSQGRCRKRAKAKGSRANGSRAKGSKASRASAKAATARCAKRRGRGQGSSHQ